MLHARLAERVRLYDRVPLQVRVALGATPAGEASAPLEGLHVPPEGVVIQLAVYTSEFALHTPTMQDLFVPAASDSKWVLFALEAVRPGTHTINVSAFREGTCLGELALQITVGVKRPADPALIALPKWT